MKSKQMMLFAVAIGCGLVAMVGAQTILSGNKAPAQEMVKILVATRDIDPGTPLDETNVTFKEWPKDNAPEGLIFTKEEFSGHSLKIRVSPNMPILTSYLAPKGTLGISSTIPKGMQIVSLPVDLTMTHSNLLLPGSYVTISCAITRRSRDQQETSAIKTVLKRVKVIAVGDKFAGTAATPKEATAAKVENVSFLVFPRQAMLLNLAMVVSNRRMQLALLGEEDASADDLMDLDDNALAARTRDLENAADIPEPTLEPGKPNATTTARPTDSGFAKYLKQQSIAPEITELGKQPSRPVWRVVIYNGDKPQIFEHEAPEEVAPAEQSAAPATTEQWAAPLMKFFSRKRSPKPEIQETKSAPADEIRPNSNNDKSAALPTDAARQ